MTSGVNFEEKKEVLRKYIEKKLAVTPMLVKDHLSNKVKYREIFFTFKESIDRIMNNQETIRFYTLYGLRGVGKTTLLFQIYDYLINVKGIDKKRILYVSMDEATSIFNTNIWELVNVYLEEVLDESIYSLDKPVFLLFDEVHHDKKWGLNSKIVYDSSTKIFMVLTGSSALNLTSTPDIMRRSYFMHLYPLNFSEYLLLKHDISIGGRISDVIVEALIKKNFDINKIKVEEKRIKHILINSSIDVDKEIEKFICCGDFPFTFILKEEFKIHEYTYSLVERIIEKDINIEDKHKYLRLIMFLGLQKPGEISYQKLASHLETSKSSVANMLRGLEKAQLIFNIKPYSKYAGKIIRKSWKYYFIYPSLVAAIRYRIGDYSIKSKEIKGILMEHLIASYLKRLKEQYPVIQNIFYDPEKEGVDILLETIDGKIIPIELGMGKKTRRQIIKAMRRYKAEHGIVIDNRTSVEYDKDNNILFLPLMVFLFA